MLLQSTPLSTLRARSPKRGRLSPVSDIGRSAPRVGARGIGVRGYALRSDAPCLTRGPDLELRERVCGEPHLSWCTRDRLIGAEARGTAARARRWEHWPPRQARGIGVRGWALRFDAPCLTRGPDLEFRARFCGDPHLSWCTRDRLSAAEARGTAARARRWEHWPPRRGAGDRYAGICIPIRCPVLDTGPRPRASRAALPSSSPELVYAGSAVGAEARGTAARAGRWEHWPPRQARGIGMRGLGTPIRCPVLDTGPSPRASRAALR